MMSLDMDPMKCLHSLAALKVDCSSGGLQRHLSYSELFGEIVATQWQGLQISFAAFEKFKDLPDQLATCNMNLQNEKNKSSLLASEKASLESWIVELREELRTALRESQVYQEELESE